MNRRILPDVPELRPLYSWIDADNMGLHRLVHAKVCRQSCERILPEFTLRPGCSQAKAQFICRIVGAHQQLNLSDGATILFIGAKGDPASKHMSLRIHKREGFLVGVDDQHSGRKGRPCGMSPGSNMLMSATSPGAMPVTGL